MKICLAQIKSITGNIEANIDHHLQWIRKAAMNNAELIVFPELSLTGYEPRLAKELAISLNDNRLEIFQSIADEDSISVAVGVPVLIDDEVSIGMIIFQPICKRQLYSKKYLHQDELPYFISKETFPELISSHNNIRFAICYEISIPQHAAAAAEGGGKIYIASVAKSEAGMEKAIETLAQVSAKFNMLVLICNAVGNADGEVCAGRSAAWNSKGELIAQLNSNTEGMLIIDSTTQEFSSDYQSI